MKKPETRKKRSEEYTRFANEKKTGNAANNCQMFSKEYIFQYIFKMKTRIMHVSLTRNALSNRSSCKRPML